jgi:glycosyltransferase involved in cell wall biosynthesis
LIKSITFVLPHPSPVPVGGHRVVYEYADQLAKDYNVNIVYVVKMPYQVHKNYVYIPEYIRYIIYIILFHFIWKKWYVFKNVVHEKIVYQLNNNNKPLTDIAIATFWSTAYVVKEMDAKNKYYFIQGYEIWAGKEEYVKQSYCLGLRNIVITNWLKETICDNGGKVEAVVTNGIDLNKFRVKKSIHLRNNCSITMIYSTTKLKGSSEGIEALIRLKNKYPELSVTFFGVAPKKEEIPIWIRYIENPSQDEIVDIYNDSAIFLSTSWNEGFGLPGAEALACGCALVTTDNKGCRQYAKDGETALLSMPGEIDVLVKNIEKMIEDNEYRIIMAEEGNQFIQKFGWEDAVLNFRKAIGLK